jgi:hypothetical protein
MSATAQMRQEFIPSARDASEPQETPFISEDEDLQQHFGEFFERTKDASDDVTVWIYRIPLDSKGDPIASGKRSYLFSTPLDRFSVEEMYERCRTEFMPPGTRSMAIRMTCTQKGVKGNRFNRLVMIDGPIAVQPPPAAATDQTTVLSAVERMLSAQQARTDALFREFSRGPVVAPSGGDAWGTLKEISTILAPIFAPALAAWVARPSPATSGLGDLLEAVKVVDKLKGGKITEAASDGDSPVAIIRAAAPFADALTEIVKKLTYTPPTVAPAPALAAPVVTQATAVPVGRPAAAPATVVPVPPAPTPGAPPVMILNMIADLNKINDYVTNNGPDNIDPKVTAEAIGNALPEELPPEVTPFLFEPDGIDRLLAIAPKLKPNREWFEKFLAELRAIYQPASG